MDEMNAQFREVPLSEPQRIDSLDWNVYPVTTVAAAVTTSGDAARKSRLVLPHCLFTEWMSFHGKFATERHYNQLTFAQIIAL